MASKQVQLRDKVITLRSPLVRDMRAVSNIKDDTEREIALVCNLSGLSSDEVDNLQLSDYVKIQNAVADFLKGK